MVSPGSSWGLLWGAHGGQGRQTGCEWWFIYFPGSAGMGQAPPSGACACVCERVTERLTVREFGQASPLLPLGRVSDFGLQGTVTDNLIQESPGHWGGCDVPLSQSWAVDPKAQARQGLLNCRCLLWKPCPSGAPGGGLWALGSEQEAWLLSLLGSFFFFLDG